MSFLVKQLMKSAVGQAATGREPDPYSPSTAHSVAAGPSHAAVVRTLMLRIESCHVPQDRRDALRELSNVPDLGTYLTSDHSASLLQVGKEAVGVDNDVSSSVLDIIATATDPDTTSVDHCERILAALVDVPFFLGFFDDASFWSKYHAVQMIQRLEQAHTAAVHQQLLATHGLHAIIDVLNDDSNGGALRNEGLVLLAALTATNQELQTIIAFENGFDSLFQIIKEESGLAGGVVVTDCLSTIMNMLRGNNATQKFFREMGCARHLVPLLNAAAPTILQVQNLSKGGGAEWLSDFATPISPDASVTLQRCFGILQCLLKGSDMNGEGPATRTALVHCGLIPALAAVAYAPPQRVDAAIRTEALRTTVLMLQKVRASCDAFAQCRVPQHYHPTDERAWFVGGAVWGTLRLLVTSDDATQCACSSILGALVDASSSSVAVASTLMKNLCKPASPSISPPLNDSAHCGPLIAASLFGVLSTPSSTSTYYVAIVLQQSLMVPQVSEQLLHVAWDGPSRTFFAAYASHVMRVIQAKQTDVCTVSALVRPLLVWLMFTNKAVLMLLNTEGAVFQFLLDWSSQLRDSVHTRFLCLVTACAIALAIPARDAAVMPPSRSMQQLSDAAQVDQSTLVVQICERTVNGKKLLDLADDVAHSDDWAGAPTSAVCSAPCVYDAPLKTLICDIIKQTQAVIEQHTQLQNSSASAAKIDSQPRATASRPEASHSLPQATPAAGVPPRAASPALPEINGTSHPLTTLNEDKDSLRAHQLQLEFQREIERLKAELCAKDSLAADLQRKAASEVTSLRQENESLQRTVEGLSRNVRELETQHAETTMLLEEALQQKEEEARTLASSLSMLESRLHHSVMETNHATELKSLLDHCALERDELLILVAEMDEEREIKRAAHDASVISPPRTATDVEMSPARGVNSEAE